MKNSMNRRMFLRGAGGAVLAIPFLPSLLTKAYAADPGPGPSGKCFMAISTFQGDIWGKNMYPDDALLTQETPFAGRQVRYGALPTAQDVFGDVSWSPVLKAASSVMTPSLAQKFNVLRGMDICWNIGHHYGQNLGNFTQSGGATTHMSPYAAPTIDQFLAYSPSFYSEEDLASRMTQRSMCIRSGTLSWNYASPTSKQGQIVMQPAQRSNVSLYKHLFEPGTIYNGIDTPILDGIKGSYDLLKKHPRLSKGDLIRLNGHLERMSEVERLVGLAKKFEEDLSLPPVPQIDSDDVKAQPGYSSDPEQQAAFVDLMIDMIVLAFSTGTSRIGTWPNTMRFLNEQISDWHGMVAHASLGVPKAQELAVAYNQGTFEHIMVKLASKMDAVTMADGTTLLDNSLIMLTNEHGQVTHQQGPQYPVVTAGGAGGYFKTGQFVDFGDLDNKIVHPSANLLLTKPGLIPEYAGLYYNQFLANALMSMGIPAEEWEHFTEITEDGPEKSDKTKGYGYHQVMEGYAKKYEKAKPYMSDKLPVIT
jgi:hypothetical protein